jgi:hypothetical protein
MDIGLKKSLLIAFMKSFYARRSESAYTGERKNQSVLNPILKSGVKNGSTGFRKENWYSGRY